MQLLYTSFDIRAPAVIRETFKYFLIKKKIVKDGYSPSSPNDI